jgi:SAM dependent carboxyl methyltransferase
MKNAIARIKEFAAKSGRQNLPISVTHTDLPTNDWTTLFQTVLFSHDSYLLGETDVFCFGSGNSIYEQIFPPNHIAFGYSAITEHWLSRKPCNIPNEIWSVRASGKVRDTWQLTPKPIGTHSCSIAPSRCNHQRDCLSLPVAPINKATAAPRA